MTLAASDYWRGPLEGHGKKPGPTGKRTTRPRYSGDPESRLPIQQRRRRWRKRTSRSSSSPNARSAARSLLSRRICRTPPASRSSLLKAKNDACARSNASRSPDETDGDRSPARRRPTDACFAHVRTRRCALKYSDPSAARRAAGPEVAVTGESHCGRNSFDSGSGTRDANAATAARSRAYLWARVRRIAATPAAVGSSVETAPSRIVRGGRPREGGRVNVRNRLSSAAAATTRIFRGETDLEETVFDECRGVGMLVPSS